ncbi:phosphatidylinositol transfer protein 3-like [Saccostrea cucullata]|uniref:phosphatidylinositol transfer protein 3-like n=1 Tax=Saccostrea cuccullata TaxID=36930 RepID=UPI002ED15BF3
MEKCIENLKERMKDVAPIEMEMPGFEFIPTVVRYLKSRDWNIDEAEKLLRNTIEYRRRLNLIDIDCRWCHERPGYHTMRQVGFDESGRPVIYSNFRQAATHRYSAEDSVTHVSYIIENAKLTMKPGISTWVFVVDCSGMTLPLCNPKLGYGVTQTLADHYPERLGMVICLNHNAVFHAVWKAIKVFLQANTASKVKLVRPMSKVKETFQEYFSDELTNWLLEEIKLNKKPPLCESQKQFWACPEKEGSHDPRGCPSYVSKYVEKYFEKKELSKQRVHKPFPPIIDSLAGKLCDVTPCSPIEDVSSSDVSRTSSDEGEFDLDKVDEIEIPDKFIIESSASKQSSVS